MTSAGSVLWRRLRYMLAPQWDIYYNIARREHSDEMLEVGFGTGAGAMVLNYGLSDGGHLTAIEIDPDAVDFAQKMFPGKRVHWRLDDILNFNGYGQFDAAVMVEVLEHIADWRAALANVHAALEPEGKLYISTRNANADLRRNELHEREVTAAEFKAMLGEFFSDVKLYDYTLNNEQGDDSRVTPLVAVCVK